MTEATESHEIVLCIPGPWADQSELVAQIAMRSEGYLFAGRILLHMATGDNFELQHERRDERMQSAFMSAGPHWINTTEMARIGDHQSVVYLIGPNGATKHLEAMILAARALLKAGGLGVKVETTGIAHSPYAWHKICDELYAFRAHRAFVLVVSGREVYSCGMHNLGMKDAIVDDADSDDAAELIRSFTWFMFTEKPTIRAGQTFAVAADAPCYRLIADPGVSYEEGSLFANPYGTWRLVLV